MVDAELWPIYRDEYGYADALKSFYQAQLAASESLKISLIEAARARGTIDKWMMKRAGLQHDD
jgi:hypothetical protein